MKKIICDICKKNEAQKEYFFETHTSFNGVDRDSEGSYYDLCDSCYLKAILSYFRSLKETYSAETARNRKLIQIIQKEIEKE